ncbi:acetylcholinesterase-like [Ixodes scapularis]|uniref:acetylcholinesterase-like n=1 Tax=Ixodes scapularis TaxID=6945 RepID=UPI001C37F5E3|nr:acetylcholinesterase-like [Ixodes scapularis]
MQQLFSSIEVLTAYSGLLLYLFQGTVCETPVVKIEAGLVAGVRSPLSGKVVDAFLGIPYAEPPLGDLRFERAVPAKPWNGTYNATSKPSPCVQLDFPFLPDTVLDYSNSSEDCLYVNVWRPAAACPSLGKCDAKLPVMVFIHGGAFQWGDSALFVHDLSNLAVMANAVTVGFNYRVGALGFLSTGTADLPGNLGFWDQHHLLKWVQKNIGSFGGDPAEVTLSGQSAGSISASLFSISPQGKGLFKRLFLVSGTPLSIIVGQAYKGVSKFIGTAAGQGCYDFAKQLEKQIPEVITCLKKADAKVMLAKLKEELPIKQLYAPVHGDEFLPTDPLVDASSNDINTKELFLGTVKDEGTIFVHNIRLAASQFGNLLATADYRFVLTFGLSTLFDIPVPKAKNIVEHYYGDYDVKHTDEAVITIFAHIFGDGGFYCPTVLFADKAAALGIKTYRYIYDHRASISVWPKSYGVVHGDDVMFIMGSLPFMYEKSKHTPYMWSIVHDHFGLRNYTKAEDDFMHQLSDMLSSYMTTGKPTIPLSHAEWPQYSAENPDYIYLRPNNYTRGRELKRRDCDVWKSILMKK